MSIDSGLNIIFGEWGRDQKIWILFRILFLDAISILEICKTGLNFRYKFVMVAWLWMIVVKSAMPIYAYKRPLCVLLHYSKNIWNLQTNSVWRDDFLNIDSTVDAHPICGIDGSADSKLFAGCCAPCDGNCRGDWLDVYCVPCSLRTCRLERLSILCCL